jgi:RNA polymerase sigma factor (sigma-70 family)
MKSSSFMKYVYYRAKLRYGKEDYRNAVQEAVFKHQCYILRGKKKRFVDVLVECNVLSEDEIKMPNFIPVLRKLKEDRLKIESQKTEVDKSYEKYRYLVQYFVHRYGIGRLPISRAVDIEDIVHDCWSIILQNVDFTNHHKAIVAYIAKTVRTQCVRSCARMLHIRIPDYVFQKIRYANRWPGHEDSWKILASPGNRLVIPLEDDVDLPLPEEESFKYEHLEGVLIGMFNRLSTKEKFILSSRFGPEEKTLEEIGEILHYTRERIRQIEETLIRRLRHQLLSTKEITKEEYIQLSALPEEGKFEKAHAPPQSQPRCRDIPPPDISQSHPRCRDKKTPEQSQPVCRDKKTPEFCHSAISAIQIKIASAR